jgi:predicted alpha/beta-hydrolase family hydrolase
VRREKRRFDDGAGDEISGVVGQPPDPAGGSRVAVILAHGAGNDMNNPLLVAVHEGLADAGALAVRFNFPYKERGGRAPDRAPVLERCFRSVVDQIQAEYHPTHLFIGGKSLGGRMASHLAADGLAIDGLLFLGYPLHPPGKLDRLRTAHLSRITAPMLFFAGTRDPLCNLDLLRSSLAPLVAPTTLHVIQDGDHSFNVLRRTGRSIEAVWQELVCISTRWIGSLTH